MSIASEASAAPRSMEAALNAGLDSLSRNETLIFTQYTKQVIAQDGYVFWVASSAQISARGSLHYGSQRDQSEDQTAGIDSVIFTSEVEITAFNNIGAGIR